MKSYNINELYLPFNEFFKKGGESSIKTKMNSNIRQYCVGKMRYHGVLSINGVRLKDCRDNVLNDAYSSLLGSDVVADFIDARNTGSNEKWETIDISSGISYVYFFCFI